MATKQDPLITATLKLMPGVGSTRADQIGWLKRLVQSMNIAFNNDEPIDLPDFLGGGARAGDDAGRIARSANKPAVEVLTKPRGVVREAPIPRFYVDLQGRALRNFSVDADSRVVLEPDGVPIMWSELQGEMLFDDRGEGDLGAITWADGSRGVLGKRINVSSTPAAKTA